MDHAGNLEADLALAATKIENALISARVAEKAAIDAGAALDRIQRAIKERQPRVPTHLSPAAPAPATTALAVRPKVACKMLDCSMSSLYAMINGDELDHYKDGKATKITVESIQRRIKRKLAEGKAPT